MKNLLLIILILLLISGCAGSQDPGQNQLVQEIPQNQQSNPSQEGQQNLAEPEIQPEPAPPPQENQQPSPKPTVTPVDGISLSSSSLSLKVGQTKTLTASITPATASDKGTAWTSSKSEVATVDSVGLVTAKGNGTATITARTKDGGFIATAKITVTTPVSKVSLNKTTVSLNAGQTAQLTATISPGSASNMAVTWKSNKPAVATVNSRGLVTAQGKGTAIITVITKDGGKTAKATIAVPEPPQATYELLMINLVNGEREDAGLEPLKFNLELTEVARIKSQDMIDNNYFAHDSPVYGSPFEMMRQFGITYRYAAENIAHNPSVENAHQRLMESPGHRANILNPNLTEIGIGIRRNSKGQCYITQMFIGK